MCDSCMFNRAHVNQQLGLQPYIIAQIHDTYSPMILLCILVALSYALMYECGCAGEVVPFAYK